MHIIIIIIIIIINCNWIGLSRLYMQPPNNNFHILLTFL